MLAFSRITSVLFFVLSLSFFAYAAPTPAYNSNEVAPSYEKGHQVLDMAIGLQKKIHASTEILAQVETVNEVAAQVDVLVADVKACAEAVAAVGANIQADLDLKVKIAAEIAACITLIVHACVALVAKFGILVLLTILAKIDICLQLLLVNLGVCVEGILKLVAQIVLNLGVLVFAEVHFGLCISVLNLIGFSP